MRRWQLMGLTFFPGPPGLFQQGMSLTRCSTFQAEVSVARARCRLQNELEHDACELLLRSGEAVVGVEGQFLLGHLDREVV